MQKTLIGIGIFLIVSGLLWPWLSKLPLFRFPGDIVINKPSVKIFFPITSMILISLILSIIMWLFRR